jgi:hypothetical protein
MWGTQVLSRISGVDYHDMGGAGKHRAGADEMEGRRMATRKLSVLGLIVAAAACNDATRPAMGDEHSAIVVAHDTLWAQVEDVVLTTLQPTVFAARDEATFRVTHESPASPYWGDLRRFRQIVAIGRPDDPWVAEPLRRAGADPDGAAILEAESVWARNQRVTVVVVPEDDPAGAVEASVDSVARLMDRRYREWTLDRMYTSGVNTVLADHLAENGGFTLRVPRVYRSHQVGDSAFIFLNDQPDATRLARSLFVTWETPIEGQPSVDRILEWRQAVADHYYDWGQDTQRERLQVRELDGPAAGGLEVRGVWYGTIQGFPEAGLFISRAVDCPELNRRYLLDAWLYAPARAKYQYIIQLETLLDSFRCAAS